MLCGRSWASPRRCPPSTLLPGMALFRSLYMTPIAQKCKSFFKDLFAQRVLSESTVLVDFGAEMAALGRAYRAQEVHQHASAATRSNERWMEGKCKFAPVAGSTGCWKWRDD